MNAPASRRARKKGETRRKILNAALELMAARGYDGVKVEDICAKADVANATFFAHFPTKAALIAAFNEDVAERIAERLAGFSLPAVDRLELARARPRRMGRARRSLARHRRRRRRAGRERLH